MVARVIDLRKGKPAKPARSRQLPLSEVPPKRPAPLRTRRRRARFAAIGMTLMGVVALIYAVHAISHIAALSIQSIRINGAEKIEGATIENYVDSQLNIDTFRYIARRNIFAYPREIIEQGIVDTFPRVRHASLSRESIFSNELVVEIQERNMYGMWCANDSTCYALDESGYVFTQSATSTHGEFETQYIFSGGIEGDPVGKRFVSGQFPAVLALLRVLEQSTGLVPYQVHVMPEQDFNVVLDQGFYLKISFGQEPETVARNLSLVLSTEALRDRKSEIEYIDLRFGNRVYYKMKGEEQANI